MMGFLNWLALVVGVGALSGALYTLASKIYVKGRRRKKGAALRFYFQTVSRGLFLSLTLAAVASPLFYEFPNPPSILYSIEKDGRLVEYPWGTFELDKRLAWMPAVDTPMVSSYSWVPMVITGSNPRVSYTTRTYVGDHALYLSRHYRLGPWGIINDDGFGDLGDTLSRLVRSAEMEMYVALSSDLGQFSDNLDDGQQQRFKSLVSDFLNKRLGPEGLHVEVGHFMLGEGK